MIFTNVSWIGDFFMLWPVASWYYKTYGEKIHFVVSNQYYMYEKVKPFLEYQDFCEKVTLVDICSDAWNPGCYKFDPEEFEIQGKYLNFGFVGPVDIYMAEYYAQQHGLGYDTDMQLKIREFEDVIVPDKVTIKVAHQEHGFWNKWKSMMPVDTVELDTKDSFELNVYKAYKAKERHLGSSSLPILMDMLGVECTVYAGAGFPEHVFYKQKHTIIKV